MGPVWRGENTAHGRFREFWQASIEAIGSDDPAIDAEVVQLYSEVLRRLGVTRWELQLNSIGDRNCRPAYVERLNAWLDEHADVLDEDARQKRATSPLRVFDVKSPQVRAALADAPKIGDSLCDDCRAHFDAVRGYLTAYGVPYTLEPTLVRGLDYYTRTVFEYVGPDEGAQSTISGGGRYDYLIEELGGPPTPGIGFGAGIDRLLLALEHENITAEAPALDVFVAVADSSVRTAALDFVAELRRAGISCDTDYAGRSLKGQLTQAQRTGAKTTIVWAPDRITIRRRGEEDVEVARDELKDRVLT